MKYTDPVKASYALSWKRAKLRPERLTTVRRNVDRIIAAKARYVTVAAQIGCPWWMIGAIHQLESSGNFKTHLHNGDPLTARTTHVPAGRPPAVPPFTWEFSALDALKLKGLDRVASWEIERVLYECERYNGWGYIGRINSPYLWSFTTLYDRGKYIADHVYSSDAVSEQCGVAAMILMMLELGLITLDGPKPEVIVKDIFEPVKPTPAPVAAERGWMQRLTEWIGGFFR